MENIQYILKAIINKSTMYLLLIFCPLFACWVICVTSSNNLINTRTAQQHNQFAFCHVDLAKTERLVTNLPGSPLDCLRFPHGYAVMAERKCAAAKIESYFIKRSRSVTDTGE